MEEIFTIAEIGNKDIIIGIDWLRHHNPIISFKDGTMEIPEVLFASRTEVKVEQESKEDQKSNRHYPNTIGNTSTPSEKARLNDFMNIRIPIMPSI